MKEGPKEEEKTGQNGGEEREDIWKGEEEKGEKTARVRRVAGVRVCDLRLGPPQARALDRETGLIHHCGYFSFKSVMRPDSDSALNTSPMDSF